MMILPIVWIALVCTGVKNLECEINHQTITKQYESWYEGYETLVNDWTLIESFVDLHYEKFYFGDGYGFDSYWLCDIDANGVPELFFYSDTMAPTTAVFTYADKRLIYLYNDAICGINLKTGEVIINGHWHGAGGTGENEWSAMKLTGSAMEHSMYIDFYAPYFYDLEDADKSHYYVYDPETQEYIYQTSGEEYEELYDIHVKPCVSVEDYIKYDFSDLSGLDNIQ